MIVFKFLFCRPLLLWHFLSLWQKPGVEDLLAIERRRKYLICQQIYHIPKMLLTYNHNGAKTLWDAMAQLNKYVVKAQQKVNIHSQYQQLNPSSRFLRFSLSPWSSYNIWLYSGSCASVTVPLDDRGVIYPRTNFDGYCFTENGACDFPFKVGKFTYNTCTDVDGDEYPWCATKVSYKSF